MNRTYEECYEAAKKYNAKYEFFQKENKLYHYARRRGWLKDYDWLVDKKFNDVDEHPYEECFIMARDCSTKVEFRDNYPSLYRKAQKEGWLKDFVWLERINPGWKYSYEDIEAIARKYTKLKDFREKDEAAYQAAKRRGYKFDWLERSRKPCIPKKDDGNWFVYGYFDNDNMKCHLSMSNRKNRFFEIKSKSKQNSIRRYFDSIGKDIPEGVVVWKGNSRDEVMERLEWFMNVFSKVGYSFISTKSYKTNYDGRFIWTKEMCEEIARKYVYYSDFKQSEPKAYEAAHKHHWIYGFDWLVRKKNNMKKKVDRSFIERLASNYKNKSQLLLDYGWIRSSVTYMHWLDEIYGSKKMDIAGLDDIEVFTTLPSCDVKQVSC